MAKTDAKFELSREQLEDIWNNKPHGYFADYIKRRKKSKLYKVTASAVHEIVFPLIEEEVWAPNISSGLIAEAKQRLSKLARTRYGNNVSRINLYVVEVE